MASVPEQATKLARPALKLSREHVPAGPQTRFVLCSARSLCIAALSLLVASGCAQQRSATLPTHETRSSDVQRRNLGTDEQRGGHTLKRHVGKSDSELQNRLAAESNISAASTYTDRETAESAVGEVIAADQWRIEQWLHRSGGHPNLVLDYDGRQAIGRSLRRNASTSEPCSHATVVLKWRANDDFIVLTSYPECR